MIIVDQTDVQKYGDIICNLEQPIAERVDALFCLRSFPDIEAVNTIIKGFGIEKKSELLRHEMCYVLGQMDNSPEHINVIQQFLTSLVEDETMEDIVIHEAVEALGNLNDNNSVALIQKFTESDRQCGAMVIETCELAQAMLIWKKETNCGKSEGLDLSKLKFTTNDPAPPFNYKDFPEKYGSVEKL